MMSRGETPGRVIFRLLPLVVLTLILTGCNSSNQVPVYSAGERTPGSYTVQRGDTLYSIAFRYGLDYRELARLNGIGAPYTIFVNQKLKIRGVPKQAEQDSGPEVKPRRSAPVVATPRNRQSVVTSRKISQAVLKPGDPKWQWPHKGKILARYDGGVNKGVDIQGEPGQRVNAAADGVVVYAAGGLRGYGKLVIVKHNDRYLSAYGHNRAISVKEGDQVKAGQKLAEIGSDGTDAPMLHFEIRRQGKPVDPLQYLPQ